MGFRFPHPAENIGDAVRDALNPDTPADGSLVIQLMNENNRAVEDGFGSQTEPTPPPDQTIYGTNADMFSGDTLSLDLPTGHMWLVEAGGIWHDVGGGDDIFGWRITSPGWSSDSGILARQTPGPLITRTSFVAFGPVEIQVLAGPIHPSHDPIGDAYLACGLGAIWVRAAVSTDPTP